MSGPERIITIIDSIPQPWQRIIVALMNERDKAKADLHDRDAIAALPEVQAMIAEAVAQALEDGRKSWIVAEREACLKIVTGEAEYQLETSQEQVARGIDWKSTDWARRVLDDVAAAIRKRREG